jgi:hypothetical protein
VEAGVGEWRDGEDVYRNWIGVVEAWRIEDSRLVKEV